MQYSPMFLYYYIIQSSLGHTGVIFFFSKPHIWVPLENLRYFNPSMKVIEIFWYQVTSREEMCHLENDRNRSIMKELCVHPLVTLQL